MVRQADILAVAVGKPELIPGDWIKPGAVVFDVGINRLEDGTLRGRCWLCRCRRRPGRLDNTGSGWRWPHDGGYAIAQYTCRELKATSPA